MSFIELNQNDDLSMVVRKCNANFRSVASQQQQQEATDRQASEATEEQIAEQIGEAVDSLVSLVNQEANIRSNADQDLENRIDAISGSLLDFVNKNDVPIGAAYTTFGAEDPSTILNGTWILVGTISIGSELMNVWKKTAS